jgi:membrane protease YdiL (CAAX protease family)
MMRSDPAKIGAVLTAGRDERFPFTDLLQLAILLAAMAAMIFFDPFGIIHKTLDALRLRFAIFTKEPRLLFYASAHIGSFIAKLLALVLIAALLATRRVDAKKGLAARMPSSDKWQDYLLPFAILCIGIRVCYASDPLVPNLPLRMVFPEAMLIGNLILIPSVLLIAPVTEELIFRGYMFDVLKRCFGGYSSVILTALLFTAAHVVQMHGDYAYLVFIFISGLIFGVMRYRFDSIVAAIVFHGAYNAVSIAVGALNYMMVGY